jgi:hypothetical protein
MRYDVKEVAQLRLEQVLHCLGMVANVLLLHEFVLWILDELSEADHQAPRVWTLCLEAFNEYASDLLLDDFSACFVEYHQNDAREVESVVVGVPELVDNGVQEVQSGLIVESVHNELEGVSVFDTWLLLASLMSDEENHATYNIGVDSSEAVDNLFALFHFVADVVYNLLVSCP